MPTLKRPGAQLKRPAAAKNKPILKQPKHTPAPESRDSSPSHSSSPSPEPVRPLGPPPPRPANRVPENEPAARPAEGPPARIPPGGPPPPTPAREVFMDHRVPGGNPLPAPARAFPAINVGDPAPGGAPPVHWGAINGAPPVLAPANQWGAIHMGHPPQHGPAINATHPAEGGPPRPNPAPHLGHLGQAVPHAALNAPILHGPLTSATPPVPAHYVAYYAPHIGVFYGPPPGVSGCLASDSVCVPAASRVCAPKTATNKHERENIRPK